MPNNIACLMNQAQIETACLLGEPFQVWRPNFSVVDQTPALIDTVMLRVTPGGGNRFAIPFIFGVQYFTVIGDRTKFLPGDILIPVSSTSIPVLTVLNYDNMLPCIAFSTRRIGDIIYTLNTGDEVYTNVRWDWISFYSASETGAITVGSGAYGQNNRKLVVWSGGRNNLTPEGNSAGSEILGMRLVETDGVNPVRSVVKSLSQIGPLTILGVEPEED